MDVDNKLKKKEIFSLSPVSDWLIPSAILLDNEMSANRSFLPCSICGSPGRGGPAIWCLRLWGVTSAAIQLAKEKMFALSIFRRLLRIFISFEGRVRMSKRELIDYICKINKTAKPKFLASFSEEELNAYLEHLMELDLEELVVCS
jgi:hypothetical protein